MAVVPFVQEVAQESNYFEALISPYWRDLGQSKDYRFFVRDARFYSEDEYDQVRFLLSTAYRNCEMADSFEASIQNGDPILGGVAVSKSGEIVACRHIRLMNEPRFQGMSNKVGVRQHAIGHWFSVNPNCRGGGIGTIMMSRLNRLVFKAGMVPVIWGGSLGVGSVKLYCRMGAGIYISDIQRICPFADSEQNMEFFENFIQDSKWNNFRGLPNVRYAWTLSPVMRRRLEGIGFKFFNAPRLG